MQDLVGLVGNISRWHITPYLVHSGQTYEIPRDISYPEDCFNMITNSFEIRTQTYMPEPFLPLLSSYYYNEGGWAAESNFEELLEEVYTDILNDITSYYDFTDEELDEELEDKADFIRLVKRLYPDPTDIGWTFSYSIIGYEIYFDFWLGDGSIEDTREGDREKALFTPAELPSDLCSTSWLTQLDMGDLPWDCTPEDLHPKVLAYSLGQYFRRELKEDMGDLYYETNETESLISYLKNNTIPDSLYWGEYEGQDLANLWLGTLEQLAQGA